MAPRNQNDDEGCISGREMDRVWEALNEVHATLREINARAAKIEDRLNGQAIKVGMIFGGLSVVVIVIEVITHILEMVKK